jgi:thiamine biosynthesis protein ThiS
MAMTEISIHVNGEAHTVPEGLTVGTMIDYFGLKRAGFIIEYNRSILAKELFDTTNVTDGDTFEIVRFVGGG